MARTSALADAYSTSPKVAMSFLQGNYPVETRAHGVALYFSQVATVLELRELSQQYPGHRALNGVSLEIPQGAFFSLLGPSGCGKTTTLRLIAGFEEPTGGEVWLGGVC